MNTRLEISFKCYRSVFQQLKTSIHTNQNFPFSFQVHAMFNAQIQGPSVTHVVGEHPCHAYTCVTAVSHSASLANCSEQGVGGVDAWWLYLPSASVQSTNTTTAVSQWRHTCWVCLHCPADRVGTHLRVVCACSTQPLR